MAHKKGAASGGAAMVQPTQGAAARKGIGARPAIVTSSPRRKKARATGMGGGLSATSKANSKLTSGY